MSIRRLALVVALAVAPAGVALAQDHKHGDHGKHEGHAAPAAAKTTVTGEVLDLVCYMQHPATGQGPGHAGCAQQCINKGLPAGLKVGDKVYLLMGKGHDSIVDKVAPLAGKNAKVTGSVIESGGLSALVIESVSAAP